MDGRWRDVVFLALLGSCGAKDRAVVDKPAPYLTPQKVTWFGAEETIRFPSQQELAEIAPPTGAIALGTPSKRVSSWSLLLSDVPGTDSDVDAGPWASMFSGHPGVRFTSGLRCAARELGRFIKQNGVQPEAELRQFITSRCGSPALATTVIVQQGRVGTREAKAALAKRWQAAIEPQLPDQFNAAGIWFEQSNDVGRLVILTAQQLIKDVVSRQTTDSDQLTIEGTILVPASRLLAVSTSGDGAAPCELRDDVALPRFVADCSGMRVAVVAFNPGGGLGTAVLHWHGSGEGSAFAVNEEVPTATKHPSADAAIVELINRKRRKLGRSTLSLSAPQSAIASRLGRVFFAAKDRRDDKTTDTVAKGLMAGWEIDEPIASAWFLSGVSTSGDTPQALFRSMWADPLVRRQLLREELRRVAVGVVVSEGAIGALVVAFETIELGDRGAALKGLLDSLGEQRRQLGKETPAIWSDAVAILNQQSAKVDSGEFPLEKALANAVRITTRETGSGAVGHVVVSPRLDETRFPKALLDPVQIKVAVSVAVERLAGQPWSQVVVLALVSIGTWQR